MLSPVDPFTLLTASLCQTNAADEYADAMRRREVNPRALSWYIAGNMDDGAKFSAAARLAIGLKDEDQFYA